MDRKFEKVTNQFSLNAKSVAVQTMTLKAFKEATSRMTHLSAFDSPSAFILTERISMPHLTNICLIKGFLENWSVIVHIHDSN